MKKLNRIIACIIIISMLVMLAACTSSSETKESNSPEKTGETVPAKSEEELLVEKYKPDPNKTYEIDWLNLMNINGSPVENTAEMVQYWNEKFNVRLNIINVEKDDALNVLIAAGDAPDIISTRGFAAYQKIAKDKVLAELPESILKAYAPNLFIGLEKEQPGYWNTTKVDGKIYGFNSISYYTIYRKPIIWNGLYLERLGITKAPSTFDEMNDAFYKLAKNDPDQNNVDDTYGLSRTGLDLVFSAFGAVVPDGKLFWQEKDGSVVLTCIQPEAKEALNYIKKLYDDKVLDPEFVTGESAKGGSVSDAFINGKIGVCTTSWFFQWVPANQGFVAVGVGNQGVLKNNPEMESKLMYADPITNPNGTKIYEPCCDNYGWRFRGINKDVADKEPDKAGKILQIWDTVNGSDAHTLTTAIYGSEGKRWDYTTVRGIKNVPAKRLGLAGSDGVIGGNMLMLCQPLPSLYAEGYPQNFIAGDALNYRNGMLPNAIQVPLPSCSEYEAELIKLKKDTYMSIITGKKPIEEFDNFVEQFLKMGGQKIIDEAVSTYKASK